jgi:CRISPR-associated endonuclease/helicase Cas3
MKDIEFPMERIELERLFACIFHVPGPFGSYQIEPARVLLEGRNVILQAPTGSGKTKAAQFPFFAAQRLGLNFPRKMVYCVPMRVLARSFWADLSNTHAEIDVRLQTGEQQDDRRLEGEITFATIDQILSSFLNIPYSLSPRQGNINAGAVISSYLVFDEFHLLDPESTLPTTLEMLRMLKGITPFILMTATFSSKMLGRLASLLDAEVVTVNADELCRIPTQRDKVRRFHRIEKPLTADAVLQHHRTRSVAICNTVERAQALYQELRARVEPDTHVILLHSRFLQEHRREKEDLVRCLFSKEGKQAGSVILVATQVIEVGLDITCEVMHTEIAPASAILQRAGRCARFEGEQGDVYVYQVPANHKGEPNYAPYMGKEAELARRTWDALPSFEGENIDFLAEQRLVDLVHAEADAHMLEAVENTRYAHRKDMNQAIEQQEVGLARDLIRNDDSITILVHPNPSEISNPYDLEGFSLFSGTLYQQFNDWQATGLPNTAVPWLLKYPQEKDPVEAEDRPIRYEWNEVKDQRDLRRFVLFVVNPKLVQYDAEIGFRFGPGDGFYSPLRRRTETKEVYPRRYSRESYQEHIRKMLNVYAHKLAKDFAYAAAQLEQQMGLPAGTLDRAMRLAIALHDVGKLNRSWQRWAHEWQRRIGASVPEDLMLAHTDYDSDNLHHTQIEKALAGSRPPHAVEGAAAVTRLIHAFLDCPREGDPGLKLVKAIFTAIARHHTPRADSFKEFDPHPVAGTTLAEILAGLDLQMNNKIPLTRMAPKPIANLLVHADSRDELLAYFIIVRALRLADQKAMETADDSPSEIHA